MNTLPKYNTITIILLIFLYQSCATITKSSKPKRQLDWIVLSEDGSSFIQKQSKNPFTVWGVNYDHDRDGRLIEDYWVDEWDTVVEDFYEIKALGANVVRVHLQFGKFMNTSTEANQQSLDQLKRLLELAEETGLYLDITGLGCYHIKDVPEWYDSMSEAERWDAQANFWRAIATTCANSPAVFCYDLMNEPVTGGNGSDASPWLAGELGGKYFVQRITLDAAGRTGEEIAKAWVDTLVSAIHKQDRNHLITVGVIPWAHVWENAKPLFYSDSVSKNLDFVSVHFYPKTGEVDKALQALAKYDIGKPLVIEEMFPLSCSIEEMNRFIDGSHQITEGWISFYWGKTIAEYEQDQDMPSSIIKRWLEYYTFKSKAIPQ
jgi:sugar phosphate isomerase/epimerase